VSPGWLALGAAASLLAGAVASVTGSGIGSLLTPVLAARTGMRLAVAAVAIPHVAGTALRFWMLRAHVDRRLLWRFGLLSGAGGLVGALLQERAASPALTAVFGGLLVFAGLTGLTGWVERMRFKGWMAWAAGALSGLLGGLVGNQGGIRSAAMLGFDVPKQAFVATATAVALMVDGARLPVYLHGRREAIAGLWPFLSVASAGVLVGTAVGGRVLRRVPEGAFRRIVSAVILVLGLATLGRLGLMGRERDAPGGIGAHARPASAVSVAATTSRRIGGL
jgi:hypothetical protein